MPRRPSKKRPREYGTGGLFFVDGKWRISVRLDNGKRIQKAGFHSREDAEKHLHELRFLSPKPGKVSREDAPVLETLFAVWTKGRENTILSTPDDRSRWKNHLSKRLGHLRPGDVTPQLVKSILEERRAVVGGGTTRLIKSVVSTFFTDLVDDGWVETNPAKNLPKAVKLLIKSEHVPRDTPYLKELSHVVKVYEALPPPFNLAFTIGAFAGLRTGEVRALRWENVHLDRRVITVKESFDSDQGLTPPKGGKIRDVTIFDALFPLLETAKKIAAGPLVCPPLRGVGTGGTIKKRAGYLSGSSMNKRLKAALIKLKLLHHPELKWYECTRHTFASHYVMKGGTLEALRDLMGHHSVTVTERYAHLIPNRDAAARAIFKIELSPTSRQPSEPRRPS